MTAATTISGNNAHAVERAAQRAIALGAFWHRSKATVEIGYESDGEMWEEFKEYTAKLDRRERRHE